MGSKKPAYAAGARDTEFHGLFRHSSYFVLQLPIGNVAVERDVFTFDTDINFALRTNGNRKIAGTAYITPEGGNLYKKDILFDDYYTLIGRRLKLGFYRGPQHATVLMSVGVTVWADRAF